MKRLMVFLILCMGMYQVAAQETGMKYAVKDLYYAQAIIGARILVNHTDSLVSDESGNFSLSLPDSGSVMIQVTAVGYNTKTLLVKKSESLHTIFLNPVNYETNFIQVRGLYNGKDLFHTPGSIANLVVRDLERNNHIDITQSFNLLPGVRMEFRSINTGARIILRGYGNQNNFNGIGYKAYYNDIPLTDADGTTNLDDIDFATLGRVEVFRGPVSSVYGTGIGGVVSFLSEKAPEGISVRQSVLTGSDHTYRYTTSVGVGNGNANIQFNYGQQESDGYRMHNHSRKNFWTLNGSFYNSAKSTLSFYAYYTKSYDQLSGQVDMNGLQNNPDSADITYIKNDSHSDLESVRMGVTHEYQFTRLLSNKTTFFVGNQVLDQGIAAILTHSHKSSFGFRTAFIYSPRLGKNVESRITLGMEATRNIIYQKSYNLNNGVLGSLRTDQEIKPLEWNVFAMIELTLSRNTLMVFSSSANFISYDNLDLRITGNGYQNQSGYKIFTPLITPRWVVNHLISKTVSVYSNYSMGFAQPGTNQFVIPQTGKVNQDLKPEISNTFEVGTKASFWKESFNLNFAFFNMDVTDKLIPQFFKAVGSEPAYIAFVNAGAVNYSGVELSLNYVYRSREQQFFSLFRPFLSYTYNGSRNSNLKSDNNNSSFTKDYSNLPVSGLARNILNTGMDIETRHGFYLNLTDMFTDKMPITLDNTVFADSYQLVNMKLGFRKEFGKPAKSPVSMDIFYGNNNIFSSRYSQFVVLNLVSVSGIAPRYFTPGPGSKWYGGVSVRYTFP